MTETLTTLLAEEGRGGEEGGVVTGGLRGERGEEEKVGGEKVGGEKEGEGEREFSFDLDCLQSVSTMVKSFFNQETVPVVVFKGKQKIKLKKGKEKK